MPTKVIQLYDPIGDWDISAQLFARWMQDAAGHDIELRINSPGGEVSHGFAIANMIKGHVGKKTAIVEGYCASAATLPAVCCDELHMHEMSMLLVHKSSGGARGHAEQMEDAAKVLNDLDSLITSAYKRKTGAADDVLAGWMARDTWMTPTEALAAKLCDKIIPGPARGVTASANTTKFFAMAGRLPDDVRAFMIPAAAAPKPPVAVPVPPSGATKMKSSPITRGLLLGLTALAHFGALASASADPEEKALGDKILTDSSALTTHAAQLADVKDAPSLTDLLAVHAKAVELTGSSVGVVGGLDAIALNASAKGAAQSLSRMAQVDALLATAVNPQKGTDGVTPPRKLSPLQAAGQRAQFVANLDKPVADLAAFVRLAHPLPQLNATEDQAAQSGSTDSSGDAQADADFDSEMNAAGNAHRVGGAK